MTPETLARLEKMYAEVWPSAPAEIYQSFKDLAEALKVAWSKAAALEDVVETYDDRFATMYDEKNKARVAALDALWVRAMETAADAVKNLSHEDGLGLGSQRIENAIKSIRRPNDT